MWKHHNFPRRFLLTGTWAGRPGSCHGSALEACTGVLPVRDGAVQWRQVDAASRPEAAMGHRGPGRDHRVLPGRGRLVQENARSRRRRRSRRPSGTSRSSAATAGSGGRHRPRRRTRQHRRRTPAPRGIATNWSTRCARPASRTPTSCWTSTSLSMVIVRVRIPTGISTTDRLDAEVELPPAAARRAWPAATCLRPGSRDADRRRHCRGRATSWPWPRGR